jgi:protein-tyrosine phosphatase
VSGWRSVYHPYSTLDGPGSAVTSLSWIGGERIAIGCLPTAASLARLADEGVTHLVNCRSTPQTWVSGDLAAERDLLGPVNVVHAPMWDFGQNQRPGRWSAAARFAARALDDDPEARVFIHCQQGRRRSVMVAYAVLRLRGHPAQKAADLIVEHRREAQLVPVYLASVERWLVPDPSV